MPVTISLEFRHFEEITKGSTQLLAFRQESEETHTTLIGHVHKVVNSNPKSDGEGSHSSILIQFAIPTAVSLEFRHFEESIHNTSMFILAPLSLEFRHFEESIHNTSMIKVAVRRLKTV